MSNRPADFDYQEYLGSRAWALLRERVRERSDGWCERCWAAPFQNTHHITYERLGHEELDDLAGVCRPCHAYLSAKAEDDPARQTLLISERITASREHQHIVVLISDREYKPGLERYGQLPFVTTSLAECRMCRLSLDLFDTGWFFYHLSEHLKRLQPKTNCVKCDDNERSDFCPECLGSLMTFRDLLATREVTRIVPL